MVHPGQLAPPPPIDALGLQDVRQLLNLSLDEVLEYVSLGYLPPFAGSDASAYRFRMREVRGFASKFLGLTPTDLDTAVERLEAHRRSQTAPPAQPEAARTVTSAELVSGGFVDFSAHRSEVQLVQQQKDLLFAQYAKYREQVGYRIGQLETLLEQEQRKRSAVEEVAREQEGKVELLKQKLIEARRQMDLLELQQKARRAWWRRIVQRRG